MSLRDKVVKLAASNPDLRKHLVPILERTAASESSIRKWMKDNVREYEDRDTGEVDATAMVEAWDSSESTGEATVDDENHPAWDIAVEVGSKYEKEHKDIWKSKSKGKGK